MDNFKNILNKFDNLGLDKKFVNNCSFDEMTKKLRTRDVLITSNTFFNELYKLHNLDYNKTNTKKILTSYIITSHPSIILNKSNNLSKNIILSSRIIVNKLSFIKTILPANQKYLNKQLKILFNNIDIYIKTFNRWKEKDKFLIIDELIVIYYEIESMDHKSNTDKEIKELVKNNTKTEQKKIIDRINDIGGEEGIKYFEKNRKEVLNFQNQIKTMYENIDKIVHDAFWNNFEEKLNKDDPDLSIIVNMLKDIKVMLYSCVPNRLDIHNNINEEIDIKYIEQLIEHKSIDDKMIINYVFIILGYIKQFQAPEDDKKMEEWIKKLEKDIDDLGYQDFENYINISDFFPKVFRKIFESLEKIIVNKNMIINK